MGEKFFASTTNCSLRQGLSENTAKAGALGHRERQSDRRKLLSATMSPMANACGVVAESPAGERSEPGRPNKNK